MSHIFDDPPHGEGSFYVSFDKSKLDYGFIVREIRGSYWGGWRTPQTIFKSIDHSICAGVYQVSGHGRPDQQVGFGRVVTDYATFCWICDIIITAGFRHQGLGKFLMSSIMEHPDVKPRGCLLTTKDAHGLYHKFGFSEFEALKRLPENLHTT